MTEPTTYKAEFVCITKGLLGSEGPVFSKDGSQMWMVAPEVEENGKHAGQILRVDLNNNNAEVILCPKIGGYGGLPAGCQVDKDDTLWVADMRLGLLHVRPNEKSFEQIAKRDYKFQPMQGCNDCAFDCNGNLWITAPAGQIAPSPYTRSTEEAFGSIYCYTTEKQMIRIDTGYLFPNGIAVQYSPKGALQNLIVAETFTKTLWSVPFTDTGMVDVSKKSVFGHCPGHHKEGPDGMDFDAEGNLLVANWGSGYIDVFGRFGGRPHTRIPTPFKRVSNLHFKPGSKQVFVTEHDTHGLWYFDWTCEGAKQYCQM